MDPIFEKNLIPTKEASELSGYTSDYLARLARSGKISARRVGHTWFVDSESLKSFLDQQGDRKIDYARALARAREKEYRARHASLQQLTSTLTKPIQMPEKLDSVVHALRSHALAVSLSLAVVVSGALVANVAAISPLANQAAIIAHDVAYGFDETFGDIPSRIALRIAAMRNAMSAISSRVASRTVFTPAHSVPTFADLNLSSLQMKVDDTYRASRVAFFSNPIFAPITRDTIQSATRDAYALITHPSRIADSFMYAYVAIGADTYAAINASLSGYRSLIEESGIQSLALASAARDALRAAPNLVARMNLAFGEAIIGASRAAIRADTMVAYGLAEAAPRSARATVTFLGETGDLLARSAARAPALATALFLRVTRAPAHIAPALAGAVFNAEYAVSARFVKDTQTFSEGYLGALTAISRLAYEGTSGTIALARTAPSLIAETPGAIEDAYLAALGRGALALDSLARVPQAAAALHTLSAGERIAFAVYETVRNFFDATRRALAFLFGSPPKIAISPPEIIATTSATSAAPARVVAVNNYPTYTTVVRGVSEDFMNQSLASLRTNVLATVAGMIQPLSRQVVNNSTTIQQVNMIQDLSNLIVRNGDFRGSIFDSGIRVTATDGNFTNLTGGTTSLGATSVTGALAVSGALSSGTSATAPYFTATSTTATSTFAGPLAVGTTTPFSNGLLTVGTSTPLLYVSSSSGNIGIGTTSPAFKLDVNGIVNATALYVNGTPYIGSQWTTSGSNIYYTTGNIGIGTTTPFASLQVATTTGKNLVLSDSGAGTDLKHWLFSSLGGALYIGTITDAYATSSPSAFTITNGGNIGIGTTSPYAKLSVEGASALGNSATAGYFTATTSAASTFPYASTTALTVSGTGYFSTASTTNLTVSGSPSGILVTNSSGTVSASTTLGVNLGGTGATTLNDLITLGTHTTGNYLATLANAANGGLTVSNSGTETAAVTVGLDLTNSNIWTGLQKFFGSASSTLFSANQAYFGATATSSFSTTGALTLASALAVTSGGTGQTSFTADQLHYGSFSTVATTTFTPSAEFTIGGTIGALVGGANSTLTLATNGISLTKLAQIAANTILGNSTGATGNVTAIATSSLFTWTGTGDVVRATSPTIITPTFTGLSTFDSASTTLFSSLGPAYFGSTATSSFSSAGVLTLASALGIASGGTASSTALGGILVGNGLSAIKSLSIGTNLTFDGTTLNATGGSGGSGTVSTSTNEISGYLPRWTSTSGTPALLGNSAVFQSGSNIGIGTTSPYATLSVWGGSASTGNAFEVVNSASTTLLSIPNLSTGTSTFATALQALALNITSTTATSTFANGINLTNGCFAIGGTCVGGGGAYTVQVFTSSGTWTKPAGVTKVRVRVVGSGGGGAGGNGSVFPSGGSGGGGAEELIDVSAVSSVSVTVGAGGSGGAINTAGSAGNSSSFGSYLSATGGGAGSVTAVAAAPGIGSDGDINVPGGFGAYDQALYPGRGGMSGFGLGYSGTVTGSAGRGYGGGGNGGDGGTAGGAGSGGVVIVEEYTTGAVTAGSVGSGTVGQLSYYAQNGSALTATSSIFLATSGNVGIGTTTPNWLLQVAGTRPSFALSDTSAGANLKHWLFSSMGGNLYIGTSTDAYATSTPAALTISNAGNVGIGTSTPGTLLSINNSANFVAGATSTIYNGLSTPYLNVTGTAATSTFANGISISGGCLLIGGTCFNGASGVTLTATRVYTSDTTWTAPSNLSYIVVKVVGGGAGSSSTGVKGGAAGGYCEKAVNASTITSPVTVTIGAGGVYSGTGGNGGTSSFGSLCSATGGTGGAKGAGGIGSGGDINARGQRGSFTEDGTSSLLGFEYGGGGDAITGSGAGFPGVVIVEEYTTGAANSGSVGSGTQGQLAFYNAAGSNLTATSSIFLATSGNIGIGTTTPSELLHISSATSDKRLLFLENTNADNSPARLTLYKNSASPANDDDIGKIDFYGNNSSAASTRFAFIVAKEHDITNASEDGGLYFSTMVNGSVVRTMDIRDGKVGIGTTTPEVKLSVSGTSAILRISGDTTGNANTGYISFTDVNGVSKGYVGDGSGSNSTIYLSSGAGDIGIGGTGGDCTLTGAASGGTCFSDSRLKNVQGDVTGVLNGFSSLQLKTFYWNDLARSVTNASTTIINRGFIAQNVEQAFPELVYIGENGYKRLDYGSLGLYAIEGIKELDARTSFIANAATSTVLTVDVAGNIGIGTTTPNHMLTVAGDVGAIGFVNTSTREAKTDINYATASSTEAMLNQLVNLKVATYRYTIEDASGPLRLGFISEEAQSVAPEILSADGKGVDLYKLATFNLAATQALAAKVEAQNMRLTSLETRVTALESGAVSSASGTTSFSTTSLASAFEGLGVLIKKGIAQFNTLVFRQLVASKDEDGTSSAGSVSILAGNTVAQVNNSLVTPSTKIFVTFNSQITGSWWVSDKLAGSFRVVLSEAQAGDVSFDYFLVQTEGALATSTPPVASGATGTDTTAPVITLLGDNPVYVSIGGVFVDPGITVVDDVDSAPTYITFVNGIEQPVSSIDTGVQTTYIITYSATDQRGNFATATRSVIVGSTSPTTGGASSSITTTTSTDTTPPVVTLTGAAAMEITVGDIFTDPGATAVDDIDGDLTAAIVVTGTVYTATAGLYTLTYTAADAAGNSASVSRVVTVAATSTPAT